MADFPTVLVLAGGLGTRIREVSADLPKSMVPVNGEPFIAHQLRLLAANGVEDVVICAGYGACVLMDFVDDGAKFGLKVRYSHDGELLLGTGGSVLKASKMVSSPFAVLYGDSYLDIAYLPVYQSFLNSGKKGLVTVFRNDDRWGASNMHFANGNIISYDKVSPQPEMKHIDFGLSIYSAEVFSANSCECFDLSTVMQDLISQGQLAGYETARRFYEVGSKEGLRELELYLSSKR